MTIPNLAPAKRLSLLGLPEKPIHIVLDTDTYNEIDDQFALVYALLSQESIVVEAIYAAPFQNQGDWSLGPGDGMEKSHDEIHRVLARLNVPKPPPVLRGSTQWLQSPNEPVDSPAVEDLVARTKMQRDGPLYVVAIGAITNIASALLASPEILDRIVLVWLGGNPYYWHKATEFNVYQDMLASRLIFDCGVSLVHFPCMNVTEHLRTTQAEIERFVKGRGRIGDYLYEIFSGYYSDHFARSKELWDIGPIAWMVNPAWVQTILIPSPLLTGDHTWSHDPHRHTIREAYALKRDPIFGDLFRKIDQHGNLGNAV